MANEFAALLSGIYNTYHEAALRMGINDAELVTLYIIYGKGGECDKSEIYKKAGMTRMALSTSLSKLVKEEKVTLTRGAGKNVTVTFTEKGAAFANATVKKIIDIERDVISTWDKQEREIFVKLSERYLEQIRDKVQDIK